MLDTLSHGVSSSTEPPGDGPPVYGRERELARIEALLGAAREGCGGALVVGGAAGAGKSTLLAAARARAGAMTVLATSGVESEAELPFAALHALVRPVLDRLDRLPEVQANALRGALGLGPDAGEHRLVVSVAALSLLAEAAEFAPVLCLIDDAHWLDAASAETLAFVARRLEIDRVACVFATRDAAGGGFDATGLDELALGGLAPAAAAELLERAAGEPLAPAVHAWLLEASEGNPLALLELCAALNPAQLRGSEPLLGPPPVSARVERAFVARVERLPDATQTLLLTAAVDDTGDLATVLAAAERLDVAAEALDCAERADLVRVRGRSIALRHPLLRSALYHAAPASRRRQAHAALADALAAEADADRRAWHSAAAAVGLDPGVADQLEDAAERARRRGSHAAASLALERAAALTADPERRARRLAAGGNDAWLAGRAPRAQTLLARARTAGADPLLRADVDRVRAVIGLTGGEPAGAAELARDAAVAVEPFDARRALHLLSIATLGAMYASDGEAIVAIGEAARRIEPGETPVARLLAEHLRGVGAYYRGDFAHAAPHLRAALALAEEADANEHPQSSEILTIAASVGLFLGDDRAVHELHRRMVARARDRGALGTLTWTLPRLAVSDIWAGHWSAASAGLTEALDLARAQGFGVVVAYLLSELAIVAALRGEEQECRARAAESLALATAHGARYVAYIANSALVALEIALGRADEAFERSRAFPVMPGLDFWDALDRVEAAVRAGAGHLARPAADAFWAWAEAGGSAWARPVARHCRALLSADPKEAERLFTEALDLHALAFRPFERARTELAFGEFLRRVRRRRQARGHVRAALETFEALGARLWAERARVELRASGQSARRRDPSTLDALTAQERQIAQRVAEGHTNRDIAAQLFLSPRTIDFHLRNIFRKLEIGSRIELVRLDLDALG
jgi:DNA-binding CsgD family transcriptional regulator